LKALKKIKDRQQSQTKPVNIFIAELTLSADGDWQVPARGSWQTISKLGLKLLLWNHSAKICVRFGSIVAFVSFSRPKKLRS